MRLARRAGRSRGHRHSSTDRLAIPHTATLQRPAARSLRTHAKGITTSRRRACLDGARGRISTAAASTRLSDLLRFRSWSCETADRIARDTTTYATETSNGGGPPCRHCSFGAPLHTSSVDNVELGYVFMFHFCSGSPRHLQRRSPHHEPVFSVQAGSVERGW
jgi:hypothetical protein